MSVSDGVTSSLEDRGAVVYVMTVTVPRHSPFYTRALFYGSGETGHSS